MNYTYYFEVLDRNGRVIDGALEVCRATFAQLKAEQLLALHTFAVAVTGYREAGLHIVSARRVS